MYFIMFSFMNKNFGTCNTFIIYVISFGTYLHNLNFFPRLGVIIMRLLIFNIFFYYLF